MKMIKDKQRLKRGLTGYGSCDTLNRMQGIGGKVMSLLNSILVFVVVSTIKSLKSITILQCKKFKQKYLNFFFQKQVYFYV